MPEHWTALALVRHGSVEVDGQASAGAAQLVAFEHEGGGVRFVAGADGEARLLLMTGEPIDEPVVGYGPFVMNSQAEIHQAISDFNSGRFGRIPA